MALGGSSSSSSSLREFALASECHPEDLGVRGWGWNPLRLCRPTGQDRAGSGTTGHNRVRWRIDGFQMKLRVWGRPFFRSRRRIWFISFDCACAEKDPYGDASITNTFVFQSRQTIGIFDSRGCFLGGISRKDPYAGTHTWVLPRGNIL